MSKLTLMGVGGPATAAGNSHSIDIERGSSQYLSVADHAALSVTGDMTIELWVKIESQPATDTEHTLVAKYGGAGQRSYVFDYIDVAGTTKLRTIISAAGTTGTVATVNHTLTLATWTHVAMVYTAAAGTVELFVNGSSIGSAGSQNTSIHDGTAPFTIGALDNGGSPSSYFDGLMDDVRLWSSVRTGTELTDNKGAELVGNESGLNGYWKLNNALTDSTANANDLTNNGPASFSTDVPF